MDNRQRMGLITIVPTEEGSGDLATRRIQITKMPPSFALYETTSGCINFNNYFLNAQFNLLYILTTSSTQGMTQRQYQPRVEGRLGIFVAYQILTP